MTPIDNCRLTIDDWWGVPNRQLSFVTRQWSWLAAFAFCLWPPVAQACPTCKEALLDPGQAQRILQAATAYAVSIGLLLLVPALLITSVAAAVIRASRRQALRSGIDTPFLSR
jgi:hypothetical protein